MIWLRQAFATKSVAKAFLFVLGVANPGSNLPVAELRLAQS
jgi:hypothetical protein